MAFRDTSAASLREEIASSATAARAFLAELFDEGTFLEIGTYVKNTTENSAIYSSYLYFLMSMPLRVISPSVGS